MQAEQTRSARCGGRPHSSWTGLLLMVWAAAVLTALPLAAASLTPAELAPVGGDPKATGWGPKCFNISEVSPNPAIWMNQCDWLDTSLTSAGFTPANGWNFRYSDPATGADFSLTAKLDITQYYAWVVNEPKIMCGDGVERGGRAQYQNKDRGGAVFYLEYTPAPGTSDPANIHWIQAVNSRYGNSLSTHLDDPNKTDGVPWYDSGGAAGNTWFADIPSTPCVCPCCYSSDVDFQVFLAVDNVTPTGTHNVDIYEGIWWGYDYECVPEPVTMLGVFMGLSCLGRYIRRRQGFGGQVRRRRQA